MAEGRMQSRMRKDQRRSITLQFRNTVVVSIVLLIIGLMLCSAVGVYVAISQQQLGNEKVAIHNDENVLLQSLIDQETGLRGYIATNNSTFLQPLTAGQAQYTQTMQKLSQTFSGPQFQASSNVLLTVQGRVSTWTNSYENPQLANMRSGNVNAARADAINAQGKTSFDSVRAAIAHLQQTSDNDLTVLQNQENAYNYIAIALAVLLMLVAVIVLWSAFIRFANTQRALLDNLIRATSAFGEGDLTARVQMGDDSEFNEVGQTFNRMAGTLQSQRTALYDRDIFGQVLQLNTVLTESLDLSTLVQTFFRKITNLLDSQISALFLYDDIRKKLVLYDSHGLELVEKKSEFALGEGLVGHVAEGNEPLLVSSQEQVNSEFPVRTIMGAVLPSSLYHLPLRQNNELLGVMVIGSIYPMSEKTQNILQVTGSNIASAIRNARTYERVQVQASELVAYSRQQEESNQALRHQRDELTVLNSALEEANRVRSQFLSTMSHELRTPLASIIGFSQILQRSASKYPLNERQISNVDRILKNAQHLLALINDVLDLSKIEAGRMDVNSTEVNVRELITSVVDEVQSIAAERKLSLSIDVADDIPLIETDPRKVHQIVLNLISNALKFTEQGEVSVSATRQVRATSEKEEGEQVAISVRDTGIGIEPEKQKHIFEAFYQVDSSNSRSYGGTGLGLSIVSELATLLGGRVEFESKVGEGSTFTLLLPLRLREQRLVQDSRLRAVNVDGDKKVVLPPGMGGITGSQPAIRLPEGASAEREKGVLALKGEGEGKGVGVGENTDLVVAIDDNPDVLQLIAASLEQSPYQVVGVQDPTRAVAVIKELRPKAVTLDIMMPQVNGWQILHRLKSNPETATIPVILLTVLEDRSAGHVLGADDYLVKPVNSETLVGVLRHVMENAQSQRNQEGQKIVEAQPPTTKILASPPSGPGSTPAESLLLAHSGPDVRALIQQLTQEKGYTLYQTHDEQELMQLLRREHPDFLMILMNRHNEQASAEQPATLAEEQAVPSLPVLEQQTPYETPHEAN